MVSPSGIFITFEGTEGAGKSTLIRAVEAKIRALGETVTVTREPGGSPIAESIRELILKQTMDPWAELFLYEAARAEHLAQTIRPALARKEIVLCDRFADSSLAYQAHARGLPWREVRFLNKSATRGLKPHLTILLDIDPARGLSRARDANRFEHEGVDFQTRVRQGFLKARAEEPSRWLRIEADSGTPEELADKVLKRVTKLIAKRNRRKPKSNG